MLAYARTALAVVVVGVTALHVPAINLEPFVPGWVYLAVGWILLALGLGIGIFGARRFRVVARRIEASGAQPPPRG